MNPRMTDVVLPPTFEQTASFTPGPWSQVDGWPLIVVPAADRSKGIGASTFEREDRERFAVRIASAECDVYSGFAHEIPKPEAEANARLIAAAPDLLEALRNFTDGRDIAYTDALVIARDAIAKAGA